MSWRGPLPGIKRAFVLGVALALGACSGSSLPQAGPWTDKDVEYQLSVVDNGSSGIDEVLINRYANRLDRAEELCTQERTNIADMSVRATQLAAEEGVEVSAMEVLEGVAEAVPAELAPLDCAEVIGSLVLLMTQ